MRRPSPPSALPPRVSSACLQGVLAYRLPRPYAHLSYPRPWKKGCHSHARAVEADAYWCWEEGHLAFAATPEEGTDTTRVRGLGATLFNYNATAPTSTSPEASADGHCVLADTWGCIVVRPLPEAVSAGHPRSGTPGSTNTSDAPLLRCGSPLYARRSLSARLLCLLPPVAAAT